jgi:hypothetical protein
VIHFTIGVKKFRPALWGCDSRRSGIIVHDALDGPPQDIAGHPSIEGAFSTAYNNGGFKGFGV